MVEHVCSPWDMLYYIISTFNLFEGRVDLFCRMLCYVIFVHTDIVADVFWIAAEFECEYNGLIDFE